MGDRTPLYRPDNREASATYRFMRNVNQKYSLSLGSYQDLYEWSTTDIDDFWSTVWDETGIIGHKGNHVVDKEASPAANPSWFSEASLNWAENMLLCRSKEKIALIHASGFCITSLAITLFTPRRLS
jgi:acetoacetyl-CoA synthetase